MQTKRQAIRLSPDEDQLLRNLYNGFKITRDQYPRRPDDLQLLHQTWVGFSGRDDSADDLLHYIYCQQKAGKRCKYGNWPTFDGEHEKMPDTLQLRLTADDWNELGQIYVDLQIGSDSLLFQFDVSDRIAKEFARRTGKIVPPMILAAAVITRRKNGDLPTLRPKTDDDNLEFGDIDELVG